MAMQTANSRFSPGKIGYIVKVPGINSTIQPIFPTGNSTMEKSKSFFRGRGAGVRGTTSGKSYSLTQSGG